MNIDTYKSIYFLKAVLCLNQMTQGVQIIQVEKRSFSCFFLQLFPASIFNFPPSPFQFPLFFFSIFPFFFASCFPVGQQKFPSQKSLGALLPPACYATAIRYVKKEILFKNTFSFSTIFVGIFRDPFFI